MLLWDSASWAPVLSPVRLWAALLLLGTAGGRAVFQRQPMTLQYEGASPPGSVNNHDKEDFRTSSFSSHVSQTSGTESEGYSYDTSKGYTFSNPLHLIISYDWLILQVPAQPVFEGDSLILPCLAWGDWPLSQVTFYRDGSALGPPGPDSVFSIGMVHAVDSGHYHCSGIFKRPGPGAKKAASVFLQVQELFLPPTMTATPSTKPPEGSQMTLSCETKLSPQRSASLLHFSFYKDGRMVRAKDRCPKYSLPEVQLGDSGSYWCETATADGQIRKQSLKLEIQVQNSSSRSPPRATAPSTSDPAPEKPAVPKPDPPDPRRPPQSSPHSSESHSDDGPCSNPPLTMQDPHLNYQMQILLHHMQNVRTLLGHVVLELRDLSGHLQSKVSGAAEGPASKAHGAPGTSRGPQRE
ncbi:Fc receptor-like A isoform X3 [Phascolarctos cinereus]|uniref:Fc receptor-like A isoform X1 n=2 Tax=Phascolarctos cinereus TaxID=38626 RepID=A0A6P5KFF5_PHACI|nr:Fc receptor-like A isoform X1 [Phascolarctos cinereus]